MASEVTNITEGVKGKTDNKATRYEKIARLCDDAADLLSKEQEKAKGPEAMNLKMFKGIVARVAKDIRMMGE